MTNIKKIGLTALAGALAMTSANAASLSVTGETAITYTKGGGYQDTGNPLGQANDLSFTGSGELDNGWTFDLTIAQLNQDAYSNTNITVTVYSINLL